MLPIQIELNGSDRYAIVDALSNLRCSKGIHQSHIARRIRCTQSKVSKLENGTDNKLNLLDLHRYVEAIGCRLTITISDSDNE
jgi:transcriptional regulator with XRE-family HTH domain